MERFFGGNPALVLIRLAILSLILGVILAAVGLNPYDIWNSVRILITRVWEMGFDAIEWAARYFLLGALIVFPLWFIARLIKMSSRPGPERRDLVDPSRNREA
jgi:hypothetical protein